MKGWKTKAGAIGMILAGVSKIMDAIAGGTLEGIEEAIILVSMGLGTLGIGHKIEKAG